MTTTCRHILAGFALLWTSASFSQEAVKSEATPKISEPLYELGVAGGLGELPDYPGSNQKRIRYLALPYFIYRGKVFRSDQKEGMRARFIQNEDIDLDMSAAGSFPATS